MDKSQIIILRKNNVALKLQKLPQWQLTYRLKSTKVLQTPKAKITCRSQR
jgi:hypothetical protein